MTQNLCACCGKPLADGATVCHADALSLAQTLREAAGHAEDANTVIARQARYGGGARGGTRDSLPANLKASAAFATASRTIGRWAQRLLEETDAPEPMPWRYMVGPLCPPRRPGHQPPGPGHGWRCEHASCATIRDRTPPSATANACTWLADHVGLLRKHPAAAQAFRELEAACHQLERLVDRPAGGHRLVGMCDCGQILYAPADRAVVQCKGKPRSCGATWNVDESQDILMAHLDEQLVTAAEAAHLAAFLDTDRTQEQIRKLVNAWSARSRILAHGHVSRDPTPAELEADPEAGPVPVPVPTFRFGEIRGRLAATPRRNREGAAA